MQVEVHSVSTPLSPLSHLNCQVLTVSVCVYAEGGSVLDGGGGHPGAGMGVYWPSPSALTARLRRLITASQRFTKSRQILQIHQTQQQTMTPAIYTLPPMISDTLNPKMAAKIERQQR